MTHVQPSPTLHYPPPSYPLSPRPSHTATAGTNVPHTSGTPSVAPAPPDLPVTGSGGLALIAGLLILLVGIGLVVYFRRRP